VGTAQAASICAATISAVWGRAPWPPFRSGFPFNVDPAASFTSSIKVGCRIRGHEPDNTRNRERGGGPDFLVLHSGLRGHLLSSRNFQVTACLPACGAKRFPHVSIFCLHYNKRSGTGRPMQSRGLGSTARYFEGSVYGHMRASTPA